MRKTDITDPKVVKLIEEGLNYKIIFDEDIPRIVTGEHQEAGRLVLLYLPDKVILMSELTRPGLVTRFDIPPPEGIPPAEGA